MGIRFGDYASSVYHYNMEGRTFEMVDELLFNSRPFHICFNPYLDEEMAIIKEDGSIHVWQSDLNHGILQIKEKNEKEIPFATCDYSSHVRKLLVADRLEVSSYDFRISSKIQRQAIWKPEGNQVISAMKVDPFRPFHVFVATNDYIHLVDERYTRIPLFRHQYCMKFPLSHMVIHPLNQQKFPDSRIPIDFFFPFFK